ncbi:uncharacterized protein G2W53_016714 [Senna tora]|uniref:Uncharacterized protein n=1 Tax=Senna tora TaxID=362788 RepID=A0A834TS84_9FABA|nr:uncharacterized protein G2W53_016714 [Senna tora]
MARPRVKRLFAHEGLFATTPTIIVAAHKLPPTAIDVLVVTTTLNIRIVLGLKHPIEQE